MCKYCDINSYDCCIFIEPLTKEYYLDIETSAWDQYDDGFIHQREYINYCPYCGKKLKENFDMNKQKKVTIYVAPDVDWQVMKCGDFKTEAHQLNEDNIEELLDYLDIECEIVEVDNEDIMKI